MLKDESIKKLSAISTPKVFKNGQYICYEGEPGHEMYIILRGSVGIYVTNSSDTMSEVAHLGAGEVFGEMSVFDDLPRSASCIAAEDSICIAIGKDDIESAVAACPDVAMMLIGAMSGRIRKLNDEIYKSHSEDGVHAQEFVFPAEYDRSHDLAEPKHDEKIILSFSHTCPVCHSVIGLKGLKKNEMTPSKPDKTGRVRFMECDPLWYDIWSCPHCGYSRFYRDFFNVPAEAAQNAKAAAENVRKQGAAHEGVLKTRFDKLVMSCLSAIYMYEIIVPGNNELLGRLWLSLYRLCVDAGDEKTALCFGANGVEKLVTAIKRGKIKDEYSLRSLALSSADILFKLGRRNEANEMCDVCISGTNQLLIELHIASRRLLDDCFVI